MTSLDLSTILPEAALSIFALAALMLGAFFGKDRIAGAVLWLTVAALLVFFYNGIAEYYMPAIQEEYRAEQPLSGLILAAMKDAVAKRCRWWNWGGTGLSLDGVYHFKSRWGTQDMNYWYHTKFHVDAAGPKALSKEELLREYPYYFVLPFSALAPASPGRAM